MAESSMEPEAKRKLMARFRSKDTRPEIAVRRLLHSRGYRFRIHRKDLPGRPDIVLPGRRLVAFVHGCFWHHHDGCSVSHVPASRSEFWRAKFQANRERDERNQRLLEEAGWRVVTIWECEAVGKDLGRVLDAIGLPDRPAGTIRRDAATASWGMGSSAGETDENQEERRHRRPLR